MEITTHKIMTLINTIIVLFVVFYLWKNEFISTDTMSALVEKNEHLVIKNEELMTRIQTIEYKYSHLSERVKSLGYSDQSVQNQAMNIVKYESPKSLADRDSEAKEEMDVWSGVDEVETSYVSFGEGYDTENTAVDWNAMKERECYASGEGLIGLFAAITAKCPDWYLGDGIEIIR
ncbi:MAG: hypothetical protein COA68_05505 [Oceanobacter sp.]|jgi:hypothetical protein|nr:MAG: hypothetical protein COA68_05505 [Oceanobacter sp.]